MQRFKSARSAERFLSMHAAVRNTLNLQRGLRDAPGERGAIVVGCIGRVMPIDPQIQILLDKGTGVPATHTLPVDVARAQYEARIVLMAPAAEIAAVEERTIVGDASWMRAARPTLAE